MSKEYFSPEILIIDFSTENIMILTLSTEGRGDEEDLSEIFQD